MNTSLFLLLLGFIYVVVFGGLTLLRREGLSLQFAFEAVVLTLIAAGLDWYRLFLSPPILLLIVLYLVTMRVRLLVDLANMFAKRKNFRVAEQLYSLSMRLFPDAAGEAIVRINQGVACLQQGNLEQAVQIFTNLLERARVRNGLGLKNEAACHYNLAIAYRKKKLEERAIEEFKIVIELLPASEFARRAASALKK